MVAFILWDYFLFILFFSIFVIACKVMKIVSERGSHNFVSQRQLYVQQLSNFCFHNFYIVGRISPKIFAVLKLNLFELSKCLSNLIFVDLYSLWLFIVLFQRITHKYFSIYRLSDINIAWLLKLSYLYYCLLFSVRINLCIKMLT